MPKLSCGPDVVYLEGQDLEDALQNAISRYGEENVTIITRSNKRAGLFNQSYRNRIKLFEEDLCTGDKIMVVKNNYFWLPEGNSEAGFVANGDMAEIQKIVRRETQYGFGFCDCVIKFNDYPNLPEQQVKLITDCLYNDNPALSKEDQQRLYESVMADVSDEPVRAHRQAYLRKSAYYNALQVKFSYAITCHKSQGGQWPVVFIDQGFLRDEDVNVEFVRWLYTAITRATEKVFLINFNKVLIE
jgi:ATP-dependent exoDNAse (exonuclease V) alpha subunit